MAYSGKRLSRVSASLDQRLSVRGGSVDSVAAQTALAPDRELDRALGAAGRRGDVAGPRERGSWR